MARSIPGIGSIWNQYQATSVLLAHDARMAIKHGQDDLFQATTIPRRDC